MMKNKSLLILLLLSLFLFSSCQMDETEPPEVDNEDPENNLEYETQILAQDIDVPWEVLTLPEGRFLISQRSGRVLLLDEGEVYNVADVRPRGEGGLLGMDLSPDFENDKKVYLYYTYRDEGETYNKVSSFIFEENILNKEEIIIDKIPGSRFHNGGRIKFGPDDKLYITTGDAQDEDLSQDKDSLAGKILRINSDGTIPVDNPFDSSPVFAYGLRNPQGLAWHPETKELFASDHGPSSRDEINIIKPGENYGWPEVTCEEESSEYENPIACYSDFTLAPSGITFFENSQSEGYSLYVAGLRGSRVVKIDLDDEDKITRQTSILNNFGRIRTVIASDGALYIATNNTDGRGNPSEGDDKIIKVNIN